MVFLQAILRHYQFTYPRAMFFRGMRLFVAAGFLITLTRCANPFAPTGGPKDTSPPLALVSPKDTIVNYAGEKLIWAFDEYLQPIQKQNIQVFPQTPISIELRGRSLILSIEEITRGVAYNLLIEDAIKDYNEGNIYPPQSIWITTYGLLPSNSVSYSTTILPPNLDLTTFSSSIQSDNPPLTYPLRKNNRLRGRLDHMQNSWDYAYTWYWDANSNGTADSFERQNQLSLSFYGSNETIIHSPLRSPVTIDPVADECFMIHPKPNQDTWDSIARENGFSFSTYSWGHDTVYACIKDVENTMPVDSNQQLILASMTGTYSSDTVQALVLVADTTLSSNKHTNQNTKNLPYLLSIPSNDLDSLIQNEGLSRGYAGLYFVTFSLPSDTATMPDNLHVDVFTDNGELLMSDIYREGVIYSFYGEPSYAIFTPSVEDNMVLYYVYGIGAQQEFLVTKTLQSAELINFIND